MDLQTEFNIAIKNSIKNNDKHLNNKRNDDKYYSDEYALPIIEFFKKQKPPVKSLETNYNARSKCISICAFASSARFCYLYFRFNYEGASKVEFEKEYYNDLDNSRPTKMDAVAGNVNYECKCQEIVSKSHTPLRSKYLESDLFKEFGIKRDRISLTKKKNKKETYYELHFDVKELDIDLAGASDYSKLHFDLKQLMCHLIAFANNNQNKKPIELKYLFFVPSVKHQTDKIKQLYLELEREMDAIFAENTKITRFAKDHNISISREFVEIDKVNDLNYPLAWR